MPNLGIIASSISGNLWSPGKDYDSIATVTPYTTTSTVVFSSIPSTYRHLQIRVFTKNSADNASVFMRYNSDSASNYSFHDLYGNGATASAAGAANQTYTFASLTGSTQAAVSIIDILDYADTNKFKTNRSLIGVDYNGSGYLWFSSGAWRSTTAINNITLSVSGTFAANSHFALYGIK